MISDRLNISDGMPPKVERTPLRAQIVDILRSRIIFGHIPPGTPLVERELAETLRVSRLPVREALQELEKEGLVFSTTTNRRSVIQLTERDIRELYEVRLQLERLAVERAARNTSPTNQAQLDTMLEAMERAFARHDPTGFPRSDVELHRVIWQQAGNAHLQQLLQTMSGQLYMFASRHSQIYGWEEVIDLHRDLVAHINDGDETGAASSIEAQMKKSLDRALRAFSATPVA